MAILFTFIVLAFLYSVMIMAIVMNRRNREMARDVEERNRRYPLRRAPIIRR